MPQNPEKSLEEKRADLLKKFGGEEGLRKIKAHRASFQEGQDPALEKDLDQLIEALEDILSLGKLRKQARQLVGQLHTLSDPPTVETLMEKLKLSRPAAEEMLKHYLDDLSIVKEKQLEEPPKGHITY